MSQPSSPKADPPRAPAVPFKKRYIAAPESPDQPDPPARHNSEQLEEEITTPVVTPDSSNNGQISGFLVNMEIASEEFALELARSVNVLPIYCKRRSAELHLNLFLSGTRGRCISYLQNFSTPNKFKIDSGCSSEDEWTHSIKYAGFDIQFLIDADILKEHDIDCECRRCTSVNVDKVPSDPDFYYYLEELEEEEQLIQEYPFEYPDFAMEDRAYQSGSRYEPGQSVEAAQEGVIVQDWEIGQEFEIGQECEVGPTQVMDSSSGFVIPENNNIIYLPDHPGPSSSTFPQQEPQQPAVLYDPGAGTSGYKRSAATAFGIPTKRQRLNFLPIQRPMIGGNNNEIGTCPNLMVDIRASLDQGVQKGAAATSTSSFIADDIHATNQRAFNLLNKSLCRFCQATQFCMQHCQNENTLIHDRHCAHGEITENPIEVPRTPDIPPMSTATQSTNTRPATRQILLGYGRRCRLDDAEVSARCYQSELSTIYPPEYRPIIPQLTYGNTAEVAPVLRADDTDEEMD